MPLIFKPPSNRRKNIQNPLGPSLPKEFSSLRPFPTKESNLLAVRFSDNFYWSSS